jgi:hypothetical protein
LEDLGVENDGPLELICTTKIQVVQSVKIVKKKNREYFERFRTEKDKEKNI